MAEDDLTDDEIKEMRDNIYQQLRRKYEESPETLSDGAKAILAILSTTRYMDKYDEKGDMFADMYRRTKAAEKILKEMVHGTYNGPGDPDDLIMDLIPIDMVETAIHYSELDELRRRMEYVLSNNAIHNVREYEKEHGEPFSEEYLKPFNPARDYLFGDYDLDSED